MQRIYLPETSFSEQIILIEKEIYHQLTRVMRARVWQSVIFFDGVHWLDHKYKISYIDKNSVTCERLETITKNAEWGNINLFQAFPNKLTKMEYIIQKSVEIWYQSIIFFDTDNSQKLGLTDNKKQRIEKIAIEALEQCGGNFIPKICYRETLTSQYLHSFWEEDYCNLICHTDWKDSLALWEINIPPHHQINIFVGPEWGFSESEATTFIKNNYILVNFWNRILRCETVSSVVWFFLLQSKKENS